MYSSVVLVIVLVAAVAAQRGEIGEFTTLAHEVSGTVHILGSRTIYFENFNYDGQGPDTVLYYYSPGVPARADGVGGVLIDLPFNSPVGDATGRLQMRRYSNEDFMVTLPEGISTCAIGSLTVWCRQAGVLFAQIAVPRSTFVNNGAEPCAAIGSAEIGAMETLAHEVSGTLHILDSRTIYIENFNYDGRGPDTLLYYYAPGQAVGGNGGTMIPLGQDIRDSEGRFQMRRFTNEGIVVTLPEGSDTCGIGTLTVWCRQADVLFGTIEVSRSTFVDGASPCTVIADGSGGLLLNPLPINDNAERGEIGDFTTQAHGVSGTVHILSSRTILLQNFNYDGQGPDTVLYYYAPGAPVRADGVGGVLIELPFNSPVGDEQGRFQMRRYSNEDILVTLPEGNSTCDIGSLTVWCRQAGVLFAQIAVPRSTFVNNGMDPCRSIGSAEIGDVAFETPVHGVSGTLHILDSRTIYIENFNYDGQGPDTLLYFYAHGQLVDPASQDGTIILLTQAFGDSQGKFQSRRYINDDIVLTLPEGMNACDIGTLTVWCRQASVFFGQIAVPRSTFVNDGAAPCTVIGDGSGGLLLNAPEFDNCIPLHETLQLSWRVNNANSQVRVRLCGCQSEENMNQYMGFGLSGSPTQTLMFGADPTITWVDKDTGTPQAIDYHLSEYRPCSNGVGACPDTLDSRGTCTNDVTDVTGSIVGGQQCVSFTRPLNTSDTACDLPIDPTNQNQYIVWGVGRLQEEAVQQHFTRPDNTEDPIHLGRQPRDECVNTRLVCRSCPPFENDRIIARESTTFLARIGPAAGERGFMGITGRAGWGITWYINGTLIPELVVERGKTYTFLIEGGDNPGDLSNYHPFYITDSIAGARLRNSPEMRASETVFAGFDDNGDEIAVGPLCEYVETPRSETMRDTCDAELSEYTSSLVFSNRCDGQSGRLVWTPDETTPDVVYYQCATHQNLGWKIIVESHAAVIHATYLLTVLIAGLAVALTFL